MATVQIQKPWTLEIFLEFYQCCEERANQMQDEKLQAVTVISFVASVFFL